MLTIRACIEENPVRAGGPYARAGSCGFGDILLRISSVQEGILKIMSAWVGAGALAFGIVVGGVTVHVATAQAVSVQGCGAATPQLKTTLYFGGARPKGSVSELDWQLFLRDEVTPRFPNGMTVWDAEGQWRGSRGELGHERTKVLLVVHPGTEAARQAIRAVIEKYRKAFDQESVLWETTQVCAAF
jgi:hypothetical protein